MQLRMTRSALVVLALAALVHVHVATAEEAGALDVVELSAEDVTAMGDRAPPAKPAAKKAAAVKADVKKAQKAEAAKEKAKSDKTVAKAEAKLKKVEQKIA